MSNEITKTVDAIEEYIENCSSTMFGKSIKADSEVLYDFTAELRNNIPKEIKAAEMILDDKDAIVGDANREAKIIIEKAKERAKTLVSNHEITKVSNDKANQMLKSATMEAEEIRRQAKSESEQMIMEAKEKAESILGNANKVATELTEGGYDYVNEILNQAQLVLTDTLEQSNSHYVKFRQYLKNQAEVIAKNKGEISDKKNNYKNRIKGE